MDTRRLVLLFAVLTTAAAGCIKIPSLIPPTPMPNQARTRFVVNKKFRVAVFDFGIARLQMRSDRNELSRALPAMLITALKKEARFAVFDGGNIRADQMDREAIAEAAAKESVDGYLSGTISSLSGNEVCFELRLSNAVSHEVLYGRHVCTKLSGGAPTTDSVARLAIEVSRAVKKVGNAKVTSVDDRLVFLDKGANTGVMPGMVAYLVSSGDSVQTRTIHDKVRSYTGVTQAVSTFGRTPVVIGNLYIVNVESDFSVGLLYAGDYALPGDTAFFK